MSRGMLSKPSNPITEDATKIFGTKPIIITLIDLNIKNKDLPWKFRDHSLFTGYGPVSNPEYAISVIIDHGGSGSSKAAPISKKIMQKVFELYYQKEKNV